ncbi:MAG TPA: UDP-N-acetylmuramoyl-tripeptide--D-alanyl-D-alanine ligase [Planctomycetota bacterium]|nr:UDP-N-acetylmuramoyl-tripeptide--D-alanyl-D-alanine ligase [Planctomycetota bacterium]
MMMLSQVARAVSGRPSRPLAAEKVTGISTDTRSIRAGDLFFALRGATFDAHDYLAQAFEKGAVAAVVDRPVETEGLTLAVRDTLEALGDLAAAYRMTLGARVVGVAGSNGKTTTKEMIAHILGRDRRVVKAQGSFNNQVGVPVTIFQADAGTESLILEIGTNHPGEIAKLGAMARPDIAVLVSIGAEHLEGLGSLDGVADEETAIFEQLRSGGYAVVNDDPRILSRLSLPAEKYVTFGLTPRADLHPTWIEGMSFEVRGVRFALNLLGEWNIQNALAAVAVAMLHGVPLEECARRLADVKPAKMRMERLELAGVTIINDAYNSNPESASRAVREFAKFPSAGRRVAVIGDMGELGGTSESYHRELGRQLAASAVDVVVGVGRECRALLAELGGHKERHGFESVDDLKPRLEGLIRTGDAVLLKGSRRVGLERVVKWMGERTT